MVSLDDFPAGSQAEAEADVARGEKRRGNAFRSLGGEAGAVVLHFYPQIVMAAAILPEQAHIHRRRLRIRLQRVEHDFRQRMLERGTIAGEVDGPFGFLV